jgi:hypothetical protein
MTVKELIKLLESLPLDHEVLIIDGDKDELILDEDIGIESRLKEVYLEVK